MALNEFEWTERHTQLLAMKGLTGACTERGGEGRAKKNMKTTEVISKHELRLGVNLHLKQER